MSGIDTVKKIFLLIIFYITVLISLLLAVSNLARFLNPTQWWVVALTGLIFPLLLIATFLCVLFWFFVKRRKAIIPLIAVLISLPNIATSFAFHPFNKFSDTKNPGNIRVITWNVGLMNYEIPDSAKAAQSNSHILQSLQDMNADIVCLQEFFTETIPGHYNLIDSISRRMNYRYHYFSYDRSQFDQTFYAGTIIFSKYKIVDSNKIVYPKPFIGSVIETGVLVNNDTINIITTRLQSFHFQDDDYEALHDLKDASADGIKDTHTILEKLKYGYQQKTKQVNTVQQLINNSTRPVIFTGDMNDVASSYAYSTIKQNMSDVWLDKGFGLGRTFRFIFPTLRIDYIFYDNFFKAIQTNRIITTSSDHNGLVADFQITNNK